MAHVAGGGGGKKVSSPLIDYTPASYDKDWEEWWKKQKVSPTARGAAKPWSSLKVEGRGASVVNSNRSEIERIVKEAEAVGREDYQRPRSALFDYFKLATTMGGADKAQKRLKSVAFLWKTYMGDWDGKSAVVRLATSPYSLEVVEAMLAEAAKDVSGLGGKEPVVPAASVQSLGGDPDNKTDVEKAAMLSSIGFNAKASVVESKPWYWKVANFLALGLLDKEEIPDNPDAEWLLTEGLWHLSFLDTPDPESIRVAEQMLHVDITDSETFHKCRPEVQDWIKWLVNPESAGQVYTGKKFSDIHLSSEESRAVEGAGYIRAIRTQQEYTKEWEEHRAAASREALSATFLMGSGGAGRVITAAFPVLGGLMGYREFAGAEAASRKVAETAAAQALKDPMSAARTVETRDQEGNIVSVRMTGADEANALISYSHTLPEANSIELQQKLQQDYVDEYGNVLRWGYGKDLEADGNWTPEWDGELYQFTEDQKRANIQDMITLMTYSTLPHNHPLDGNMDHPAVIQAIADLQEATTEQEARLRNQTVGTKIMDATGLPFSRTTAKIWWNQMTSEGVLQGLFRVPVEMAGAAGGAFQGVMATFNYGARAQNDKVLKAAEQALAEYIRGKLGKDVVLAGIDLEAAVQKEFGDDSEAQELYKKIEQRRAQLLNEGWGDDVIGTVGNIIGVDSEQVAQFSANHPQAVFAANFGRDVLLLSLGARIPVFHTATRIPATREAFLGSTQAYTAVKRVVASINRGDLRGAIHMIGGKDAKLFVQEVFNTIRGKTASQGLRSRAEQIRTELARGERGAVKRHTNLSEDAAAQLEADFYRQIHTRAPRVVGPRPSPSEQAILREARAARQVKDFTRALGRRQKRHGDVVDEFDYTMETAADWYAGAAREAGAHAKAIFPHFRAKNLPVPSYTKVRLEQIAAETQDPAMQWFFRRTWKVFERAPLTELDFYAPGATDRIFDAALAASNGDFAYAIQMASKWARANSPAQFTKIAKELVIKANSKFNIEVVGKYRPTEPRPIAVNVNPLTGEKLWAAEVDEMGNIVKGAVGQETRLAYKVFFSDVRKTMQAPYKTAGLEGIEKALAPLFNVGRAGRRVVTYRITNPLRRLAVGMSPTLAWKHEAADHLFRLPVESGWGAVFRAKKFTQAWNNIVSSLPARVASEAIARLHKFKMGEQMYNVGQGSIPYEFRAKTIYQDVGGTLKPVNLSAGVDDLRRFVGDPGFEAYVNGGTEGLRAWLYTKGGRRFLHRSGNVRFTKENVNEALELRGQQLYDAAVADYLGRIVGKIYEPFEAAFPRIFQGMKEVVSGVRPRNDKSLRDVILEANANGVVENPFLSLGRETPLNMKNPMNWVGTWMRPNKMAREQMYKTEFVRNYRRLVREGVEAESAARIALDVAEIKTTRAMFDLANATYLEGQNRWFAYFATKHRLYAAYLAKMGVERPWIADAALQIADWMEERNKDKNLEEWDKHKFVFELPFELKLPGLGSFKEAKLNLAAMYWLPHYVMESTPGKAAEWAVATAIGFIPGMPDWRINFGGFDANFSRMDRLIMTGAAVIPLFDMWSKGELTEENLAKYFEELPGKSFGAVNYGSEAMRGRLQLLTNLQMLYAEMKGEPITAEQAVKRVLIGGFVAELVNAIKPAPLVLSHSEDPKIRETEKAFWNMDPAARSQWLKEPENEWFSSALGLKTQNPATRAAVAQGWADYTEIRRQWAVALENAVLDNSISDPDVFDAIMDRYEMEIQKLTDPKWTDPETGDNPRFNRAFAEAFVGSDTDLLLRNDAFKVLVPLVDPRVLAKEGLVPDERQCEEYREELSQEFEAHCKSTGLIPTDLDDPVVFWLKEDMVEKPYREFAKVDPSQWMTYREQTAADVLAQGETGPTAAAKFVVEIHNRFATKALGRGVSSIAKSGVNEATPCMALMTTAEKKMVGWNSTREVEEMWKDWAAHKAAADKYLRDTGVSSQSKTAVRVRASLKKYGEQLAKASVDFGKEWEFSHLPLEGRLKKMGVGQADTPASQGWGEFFNLLADYKDDLASVENRSAETGYGVGPTAQSAREPAQRFLRKLVSARLKERYPEWWVQFNGLFPLSQYGVYSRWRLEDGSDADYWWATKTTGISAGDIDVEIEAGAE